MRGTLREAYLALLEELVQQLLAFLESLNLLLLRLGALLLELLSVILLPFAANNIGIRINSRSH